MIQIEFQDREVLDYLGQLQAKLGDLTPVMDAIGMTMESRVSGRFETETDTDGHLWAPWEPSTREQYPKDGNGRILDRYGDMLDSLNYQADSTSVTIGFGAVSGKKNYPYPAAHEYGTKFMPRRGMLTADPDSGTLGEGDQQAILDIVSNYFGG